MENLFQSVAVFKDFRARCAALMMFPNCCLGGLLDRGCPSSLHNGSTLSKQFQQHFEEKFSTAFINLIMHCECERVAFSFRDGSGE